MLPFVFGDELIEDADDTEGVLNGAEDFETVCVIEQLEEEEDLDLVASDDLDLVRRSDLEIARLLDVSEIKGGISAWPPTFTFSGSDMGTLGSCD